jgi:hypothetical protein
MKPSATMPAALAAAVLLAALAAPAPAPAATSGSGLLSPSSPEVRYTSGPFLVSNPSIQPAALLGGDQPICEDPVLPCDDFVLDVDIPAGYLADHPQDRISIQIDWPTSANDFDMFVLDETGAVVDSSATGGKPEIVILPAAEGHRVYTIRVEPFLVTGDSFDGVVTLGPPPASVFVPGAEPPPEFLNFPAPNGLGTNYGEPSIGVNPVTGVVMFTGRRYLNVAGKTLRVTFDDSTNPPGSQWVDVTPLGSMAASADPIGYTDRTTGRTFVSQLHAACSVTELTDDDGESWLPSEGCGLPTLFDHQTLGGGPFAPPLAGGLGVYPNAVYYCAQTLVEAGCAVSLDGGITFGAGVPVYTTECSGLHGHIKVAPNGTAYLPNKGCAPNQAVLVSESNGQSWAIRKVPGSSPGDSDPSVGIASDGTVYFGYVNGDGHARIAVSRDQGLTWENDTDVGTPFGIQNAVFPAVVAGDPDRAAFAFHGTPTAGNYGVLAFPGVWHLYVATTYDGGETWITVNATPENPVQGPGGICTIGISCNSDPDNRNLLDFFDATIDTGGRILVGYADGCTGDCGADGTPNDFASYGTIARQSAGLTLLSELDPLPTTEDVTDRTRSIQSGLRHKDGQASFKLKIKNVSDAALAAPLHVLVAAIDSSSSDVTVANADNGETGPGATFDYSGHLNGDAELAPNEVSESRDLLFDDPGKERFTVTLRVLQGDPASDAVHAENGENGSELRFIRLSVDPLLGTLSVELLPR